MGRTLKPEDVARSTLAALGRRSTVLPGALSKLLAYSLAPLPRWARVRIMGLVMDGMTKHGSTARSSPTAGDRAG
jgi:short-subunit dehydrogenase